MESISPAINELFQAYCCAVGLDLPMTFTYERWIRDAMAMGLTCDMLGIVIKERIRLNKQGGFKMKLGLINLIGSEDDVAKCLNEAAVVLASKRIKVMHPARATVLRQSGRKDDMPVSDAKVVGDLLKNLKDSAI